MVRDHRRPAAVRRAPGLTRPVLFSPEAHEELGGEPWSAERVRAVIAAVVADAEAAFDDGWPAHPRDLLEGEDPATRFRNVYEGGAGVVEALHRLARRRLRRAASGLCPVLGAVARGSDGLPRRGRRAQPLGRQDGNPAGAPAGRTFASESRATVRADRRERAGRALRAVLGQPRHHPGGSRARARRDAERRVAAGAT